MAAREACELHVVLAHLQLTEHQDEIKSDVLELCMKLGPLSTTCQALVGQYFEVAFKKSAQFVVSSHQPLTGFAHSLQYLENP